MLPEDDMMLPELPEEELEMDYEPSAGGTMAYMRAEDEVGPMELADLLGPESGHGYDEEAPAPLGSGAFSGGGAGGLLDSMAGAAGPGAMADSLAEDRTMEAPEAQADARNMLALRAQERLAASKEFQEKAFNLGQSLKRGALPGGGQ